MSTFLWVAAWLALWAFLIYVVFPWWVKRAVLKGLAVWEATRTRVHPDPKRPKSLEQDPTDLGMNHGYVPTDGPEEN